MNKFKYLQKKLTNFFFDEHFQANLLESDVANQLVAIRARRMEEARLSFWR